MSCLSSSRTTLLRRWAWLPLATTGCAYGIDAPLQEQPDAALTGGVTVGTTTSGPTAGTGGAGTSETTTTGTAGSSGDTGAGGSSVATGAGGQGGAAGSSASTGTGGASSASSGSGGNGVGTGGSGGSGGSGTGGSGGTMADACAPMSDSMLCSANGKECGSVSLVDCGKPRTVMCGTCATPKMCTATNVCSCTAETDAAFCTRLGKQCGPFTGTDNCGMSRAVQSCGTCTAPQTCGGTGTANVCGVGCTAETDPAFCTRLGKNCGSVSGTDNCQKARTVTSCGTCTGVNTCGGAGTANVCGAPPLVTVDDATTGTGNNQFNYQGTGWHHCTGCGASFYMTSNSWDNTTDDSVSVAFNARTIKFYAVKDPQHGICGISIDNGTESMVDLYAAATAGNQLVYTSPTLAAGNHTLKIRITGTKNASSIDFFCVIDRVDIQ